MNTQFVIFIFIYMIATTAVPLFYGLDGNHTSLVAGG